MNEISQTNLRKSLDESGVPNEFTNIFTLIKYPKAIYKYLYINQVPQSNFQISLHG